MTGVNEMINNLLEDVCHLPRIWQSNSKQRVAKELCQSCSNYFYKQLKNFTCRQDHLIV